MLLSFSGADLECLFWGFVVKCNSERERERRDLLHTRVTFMENLIFFSLPFLSNVIPLLFADHLFSYLHSVNRSVI